MAALFRTLYMKSSPNLLLAKSPWRISNPISGLYVKPPKQFSCITQIKARSKLTVSIASPRWQNAAVRCCYRDTYYPVRSSQCKPKSEADILHETFLAGIQLCSGSSDLPAGHRFFCLQVVVKDRPGRVECDISKKSSKAITSNTYQLNVEDAVGIIYNRWAHWIHSCSILVEKLSDLHNKVHSSDLRGRGNAKTNESVAVHTEVTLFALVNSSCEINHKAISGRAGLKDFLCDLSKKNIQIVYVTCSGVILETEDQKQDYSHVSLSVLQVQED